jgi:hypothetical protein
MLEQEQIFKNNKEQQLLILKRFVGGDSGIPVFNTEGINKMMDDLSKGNDPDLFEAGLNFIDNLITVPGGYSPEHMILEKARESVPIGTVRGKSIKTVKGWRPLPKGHIKHPEHSTVAEPQHIATGANKTESTIHEAKKNDPGRKQISVDDRWKHYETALRMVVNGDHKAAIAYGRGGVGKTYTLQQILEAKKKTPFNEEFHDKGGHEYDYVKITGKNTLTDFWRNLYEHNGKTLIFDDCDSVLDHDDVINILKGGLDSSGDGTVEYRALKGNEEAGTNPVPQRFKFNGRIIFITNKAANEFKDGKLQPLKSRALTVNLTMDKDETMDRAAKILPKLDVRDAHGRVMTDVTLAEKQKALQFIKDHKDEIEIDNFNTRTIGSIIKAVRAEKKGDTDDWKGLAATMLGLEHFEKATEEDLIKADLIDDYNYLQKK